MAQSTKLLFNGCTLANYLLVSNLHCHFCGIKENEEMENKKNKMKDYWLVSASVLCMTEQQN